MDSNGLRCLHSAPKENGDVMDLAELQEKTEASGDVQKLSGEIKRLLWHEGVMSRHGSADEELMTDFRVTVGALAVELAAYCNRHDIDLEQCIEEALRDD